MKKSLKNFLSLNRNSDSLLIRNIILVLLILFSNLTFQSQNLVPNGSFELHTQCPDSHSQLYLASPWFSPTGTSTDLFDSCSTYYTVPVITEGSSDSTFIYYYAAKGHAFIGVHVYSDDNREYAQVKLKDSLIKDQCYYIEFYARVMNARLLSHLNTLVVNNIAANLSIISYTNCTSGPPIIAPMHITNYGNPVIGDTTNWTKISGLYTSNGGEKYITLGNFRDNQNTSAALTRLGYDFPGGAYYFMDAVSVTSVNPSGTLPWSYRDTTITVGDSVYIGNSMGGTFSSNWYTGSGTFIKQNAGIYVRPVTTSSYIVQYTVCGVSRSDTVKVTVLPGVGINKLDKASEEIKVYPIPTDNCLSIKISNPERFKECIFLIISDQWGQMVREEKFNFKESTLRLNTENLKDGVYSLLLKSNKSETASKRFVISR